MERVTVRMARSDRRTPWGFGVTEASDRSVVIVNIVGGSLADRAGLRNGDVIDKLEDLDNLDINAVDRLLVTAHEKIELVVSRNATGGAARIWRPEVSENTGTGHDERPYKVNLQHSSDTRPPQGFNTSALPFETDHRVKHMQYNSPLGLYSDKAAAEQYVQQTQGFVENNGPRVTSDRNEEPAYLRSETLRLLKEQERAPTTLSNHPNPNGLPVCFICTRPILGVMARAAGKNLHGDCLSCATCGNSLRNVGHHFIEDKFYCDIHGTQRKAGGRPGMDPNIFVKSSPTASQPALQQDSPRAAYHPQINSTRPVSVSPSPASKQVTTHYHTPKTQGILSPSQRGVPTAAFGADLSKTVSYGGAGAGGTQYDINRLSPAPSQFSGISAANQRSQGGQGSYQQSVAPQPPSNPPPSHNESRVPQSIRSAVSPRRTGKSPRQWPPPQSSASHSSLTKYWQIKDAADQLKKDKTNYGTDLVEMIKECEKEKEPRVVRKEPANRNIRMNSRRLSNISKEQVQQAFDEHRKRLKDDEQLKVDVQDKVEMCEAIGSKIFQSPQSACQNQSSPSKPEIGKIHWTVIHSPSPATSPAKVCAEAAEPCRNVIKPIPIFASQISPKPDPLKISKTSIPQPFKVESENKPIYSPVELKPNEEIVRSYIVKNEDVCITTTTDISTTVNRLGKKVDISERIERPVEFPKEDAKPDFLRLPSQTTDSSTSPIPSIRLSRKKQEKEPQKLKIPEVAITCDMATSPFRDPSPAVKKDAKHFKKVDFSNGSPTVIPEWKTNGDIVIDESDILTEASKEEDSISLQTHLKTNPQPYDGDESEMIDNKSDVASTFGGDYPEEYTWDEPKRSVIGKTVEKDQDEAGKQWRQRAMELLEDDAQTERDLMIVAALNERLQGLREMEDEDRIRAIECIARHQSELEHTQTQLSTLLESAIVYLQNLRTDKQMISPGRIEQVPEMVREERVAEAKRKMEKEASIAGEMFTPNSPPTPPQRRVFPFQSNQSVVKSLHDVLDEFHSLSRPFTSTKSANNSFANTTDAIEDSRNFLASRLGQVMVSNNEQQGSSYTKSTFERTTSDNRGGTLPTHNQPTAAGEFRGSQHVTTTTTTTQQENGGRIPYCEACKNQIRGAFVLATGKSWCPEHFVCANSSCRRRLLECGFVEENGQKFCESCFEQHIAPRCAKCSKPIVSDCLNALQKKWHPTCFTCAHCQKPFGNSAFYLEQGLPYCEQDWNALFTTKCVSCRYPIEAGDRWVEALGNAFHSNCFTCTRCNHNLEGESFFAKNGQPFCKLHA